METYERLTMPREPTLEEIEAGMRRARKLRSEAAATGVSWVARSLAKGFRALLRLLFPARRDVTTGPNHVAPASAPAPGAVAADEGPEAVAPVRPREAA